MKKFKVWDNECNEFIAPASPIGETIHIEGKSTEFIILEARTPYKNKWIIKQFTGLLDCNGQEVYEFDKVRVSQDPYYTIKNGKRQIKLYDSIFEGTVIYHHGQYWVFSDKDAIFGKEYASLSIFFGKKDGYNKIELIK